MRVAIVGAGAMGTVMGAYFTRGGCQVDLVDSYQEHVDALNEKGAHIVGKVDMTVPVHAITPGQMEGVYDIVFLLTKQNANDVVLPGLLVHLGPQSTVCTLQNGVPEPAVAAYVGESRTVGGTVLWGATFVGPGVSELTQDISQSDHLFEIGEMSGEIGERIQRVAEVLGNMGPAHITGQLMASRWAKLVNNACTSGMSAFCGFTFGQVLDNATSHACLSFIGSEVKQCCEAAGYQLPTLMGGYNGECLALENQQQYDESQAMFLGMYEGLRTAKASMLQDLEKGKQTEVRMINGFVCDAGRKYGIATPFNDMVVQVVTEAENGMRTPSPENLALISVDMFRFASSQRNG